MVGYSSGHQARDWRLPSTGLMATAWFRTRISFSAGVQRGADLTWKGLLFGAVSQAAELEAMVKERVVSVVDLKGVKRRGVDGDVKKGLQWKAFVRGERDCIRDGCGRKRGFICRASSMYDVDGRRGGSSV